MRVAFRPMAIILALVGLSLTPLAPVGATLAQNAGAPGADQGVAIKEIALTDKQIESLLAAKPALDAIIDKLPETTDKPDAPTMAKLDAIAKSKGLAGFDEFNDVLANVTLILDGFDPQTKKYVGRDLMLKKQIAQVQADKTMPANDKKDTLAQLAAELKSVTPPRFPANEDLVARYYDKLIEALSGPE